MDFNLGKERVVPGDDVSKTPSSHSHAAGVQERVENEHGIKAQLNINSRNRQVGAWSWRLEAKESAESPCCQL